MKASEALPLGTVPTYQAYIEGVQRFKSLPPEDFYLKVVEEHLMDGADYKRSTFT